MSRSTELHRLHEVMHRLRRECPWDAEQTHRSLATYLVEETGEVLDAIESGDDTDLAEELGDLLLQVYFHAAIAEQQGRFTLDDVARGISDKLVRRHPYVFTDAEVPDDLHGTWEARKRAEKQRDSALDGIAGHLSVVARATKVASRTRHHKVPIDLPDEPIAADEVGRAIVDLVVRAQASGIDADQAARDALRELEARVVQAEQGQGDD
ncbi:MazG family protein [Aestuariimicrobium ganziense]|uniref:MazG family protein n=1 Tax=Aestuariimicrobium ganziense TaxID=2773677 RepID=UPI001944EAA0|nr:MazG family protein [Aestuariimicrobium ganziense]